MPSVEIRRRRWTRVANTSMTAQRRNRRVKDWLAASALVFGLTLLSTVVNADSFSLAYDDENVLDVEVMPAKGDLLVIWLVDHDEERRQFEWLLRATNGEGIELWRVDLLRDLFLERTSENIRTLTDAPVDALIEEAHRRSDKRILLVAYDRMPLPLLRGIRSWQSNSQRESRLAGAVLFYPNLFGAAPRAGADPVLDPIVRATNVPVTIYQPALGTHRWRLPDLLQAFWDGGSPAFSFIVPGVRDWFFMHPPEKDPAETRATRRVPRNIVRLSKLMDGFPKPAEPVTQTLHTANTPPIRGLAPYPGNAEAPPLVLPDIDGNRVNLEDTRGRVTLVNFWATWCPPCVEEIPSMNRLGKQFSAKPFSIVSVDFRETPEAIRSFADRINIEFPVLLDREGRVSLDWRVFSFPSSFILDKRGRIRYTINRAIDWNTPEVTSLLNAILEEAD